MHISSLLVGALAATLAAAHPGHDIAQEMAERREFLLHNRNDLSHCAEQLQAQGVQRRNIERRAKMARGLMRKRGLEERQIATLLNKSHKSSAQYTASTDPSTIFAGNSSCVLSPETTEGPYYVSGEKIRQDVVDGQKGVPMAIDVQVIDTATCKPIADAFVEIWHCNSTGVYGGVVAGGNGAQGDQSNLNNTMLRGVQKSSADGVVQFNTLFPGHYTGRATHIHVMVHLKAVAQANGTLLDTSASHVGQMFFDQDLITAVEKLAPYTSNKQALMTNARDGILAQEAATSDPFMQYIQLGSTLNDGLLAWLSFGVNKTYTRTVSAAATYLQTGGKANAGGGMGPGGPGGPGGRPPME